MRLLKSIAAGSMLRIQAYLESQANPEISRYPDAFPELSAAMEELDEEGLALLGQEEQKKDSPYTWLVRFLAGDKEECVPAARSLLDFATAVFLYPRFGAVLKNMNGHMATVELAFFMENEDFPPYRSMKSLYERGKVVMETGSDTGPFFHIPFFGDSRLAGFLCGDQEPDKRLEGIARLFLPKERLMPLLTGREMCDEIKSALAYEDQAVIIKGEKGRGKLFLLCHALQETGKKAVIVEAGVILKRKSDMKTFIRLIRREALFHSCGICLHGITEEALKKAEMTVEEFLFYMADPFLNYEIPVYFCTDEKTELMPSLQTAANQFSYASLTRSERIRLWSGYGNYYGISLDAVQLGSKYRFVPEEIKKACLQLKAGGEKGDRTESLEAEILRDILPPVATKGRIEPYHSGCTLEELVLPPETKEKVLEICAHVWYSHKVYDEWNMESKFAYGKAVSVLLSGPPGTGKTMTARVISNMLKIPLYHVNLSQLVDKYIGETAKHLEEIFTNAERSNIILFFDEADAVFGKRSEVTDAKDRYANTEVSYILQRMESYDGIVLLATNYKGNIDSAFMRRMKYIVNFQLPGKEERLAIWKGCIPKECPLEDIDFEYLAGQFEFSGSSIKNAILTAMFLAAKEGCRVGMKHMVRGIKNEYRKNGKMPFPSDFGEYGFLA